MKLKALFLAVFAVFFLAACDYQRRVTASEIGCRKENIVFPDGEPWLTPSYWIAQCGSREFVCSNNISSFVGLGRKVPVGISSGKSGVQCAELMSEQ